MSNFKDKFLNFFNKNEEFSKNNTENNMNTDTVEDLEDLIDVSWAGYNTK